MEVSKESYPGYITIYFVMGEDVSLSLEFNQDNGDPFDFTDTLVEAMILTRNGDPTGYQFDVSIDQNNVTFLLPKSVTSELKESSYLSFLKISDVNLVANFPREVRFMLIPQYLGDTA